MSIRCAAAFLNVGLFIMLAADAAASLSRYQQAPDSSTQMHFSLSTNDPERLHRFCCRFYFANKKKKKITHSLVCSSRSLAEKFRKNLFSINTLPSAGLDSMLCSLLQTSLAIRLSRLLFFFICWLAFFRLARRPPYP